MRGVRGAWAVWLSGCGVAVLAGLPLGGCSKGAASIQERALLENAQALCDARPHAGPGPCKEEVTRRFQGCASKFLANSIDAVDYLSCLGFDVAAGGAPTVARAGGCAAPDVKVRLSFTLAETADGGAPPTPGAMAPVLTTADVVSVSLLEPRGGGEAQLVAFEFSEAGAARLEAVTKANMGGALAMTVNGTTMVARIQGVISGRSTMLALPGITLGDLCAPRAEAD